jgi:PAS domain S-box-containing protein
MQYPEADSTRGTILIVDDQPANLRLLTTMLKEQGYRVHAVTSGVMALESAQLDPPDLILLDVDMPVMDGYEVCRRLKADAATSHIAVIFISALGGVMDKVRAFSVGGIDYITKPLQMEEVLARIATHMSLQQMQTQLQEQNNQLQQEVAERQRMEAVLHQNEEKFRLLAENARDIIFRYRFSNPRGFEYISPSVQAIMGYTPEEYYADPDMDLKTLHPDYRVAFAVVGQSPETGREPISMRHRRKDGSDVWIEQTHHQIMDETGKTIAIEGIARDITERKQAEEMLRRAHDDLERRVAERTAELLQLNTAYECFVPREFLSLLEKDNIIEAQLGDQIGREMTIMFSDIRSFTLLSERMTPQENFNFINTYLSRVSPIIRQHDGFIDKYIGDGIMALFPYQPETALQAAIAMMDEVCRYNLYRQEQGEPPITIGIGLHTGNLMLGIIGEEHRKQVTVIADAVNLAARLEGVTRLYGAAIVISEQLLFRIERPARYQFRFLDKVKVKGKEEAVSVFEILDGNPPELIEMRLKTRPDFEKGLLHYHNQEFEEALVYFQQVLAVDSTDRAARLYLERATHLIHHGVPLTWDGIEILTEK